MKNKKVWVTLFIVGLVSILILFSNVYNSNTSHVTSKISEPGLLISFTNAHLITSYYFNDNILHQEKMTEYPAMTLNKDRSTLYYTKRDEQKKLNIVRFELKSSRAEIVTKSIDYADELQLSSDETTLYMRVNQPNHRNFHLASLHLSTKKTAIIFPDKSNQDQNVAFFKYNSHKDNHIVLHYSLAEDMKNVEKANVTGNPLKPPKTIFSIIDSKQTKHTGSLTKPIQDVAIAPKGDKVIFTSDSESDDEARAVFELDLESNKYKPLFKEDGKFKWLSQSFPQYSPDGKEVYFLGIDSKAKSYTDESTGREIKERTIYSYTRQSKEFAKRWEKSNGVINNFSVLN
ncbi:hypothetical protein MOE20_02485 [Bacillus atrophaeus]|uniref:hypothetical protein n=1 Tax=Bacillus atrophaeus TaxID=1452 RepID=UPI0022830F7D|nr:hypothetical protein [Bacillus atrophaeus]MCY8917779.1 hypothetical protein [Bacillus atrophaeus]MCY8923517.1 hypothetical protein [Bacillus atrophaeus]